MPVTWVSYFCWRASGVRSWRWLGTWGGWKYVTLPLLRKSFKEILLLLSFSQVSLQERQCVTMKTMSNVLSMRRGEGNYLEQHLNNLRSSCLQSNIPSLSSILLSPHILRKPSFELWDDRDSGDNKEQPEYHSATKPWILERPPGSRRATEELPSTPSSSFSSTRRFSSLWHIDMMTCLYDDTMTHWQIDMVKWLHVKMMICWLNDIMSGSRASPPPPPPPIPPPPPTKVLHAIFRSLIFISNQLPWMIFRLSVTSWFSELN